jgi:hypothetical protein
MSDREVSEWTSASLAGAINGAINGWIAWGKFSGTERIALSVDTIASGSGTAFGNAVMLATSLGFILSLVNFAMVRKSTGSAKPGWAVAAFSMAARNSLFLFGLFVAIGVVWQRAIGTLFVGPALATALTVAVAFGVSLYLHFAVRAAHAAWLR